MPRIHPSAVVDKEAMLDGDVTVGPFAVIGPKVSIGPGTTVDHHASILGRTTIGAGNRIFPFASVGSVPQDLKYRGEDTALVIGDRNVIREFTTLNIGTAGGGGTTSIGNGCLLMAYVHVAHDCRVGDGVVMANCATLAGHITVEDHAVIGGLTGIHQFVRIGTMAMIGGASAIVMDVPPYMTATGNRAELHGLNLIGLKRSGLDDERISALKKAYRLVFRTGLTLQEAVDKVAAEVPATAEVTRLLDFLRSSQRGITR